MPCNDHLRYAVPVIDYEIFCRKVYEYHAYLATVIGIYRSR